MYFKSSREEEKKGREDEEREREDSRRKRDQVPLEDHSNMSKLSK